MSPAFFRKNAAGVVIRWIVDVSQLYIEYNFSLKYGQIKQNFANIVRLIELHWDAFLDFLLQLFSVALLSNNILLLKRSSGKVHFDRVLYY